MSFKVIFAPLLDFITLKQALCANISLLFQLLMIDRHVQFSDFLNLEVMYMKFSKDLGPVWDHRKNVNNFKANFRIAGFLMESFGVRQAFGGFSGRKINISRF